MNCMTCIHFKPEEFDSMHDCPYHYECAKIGGVYEPADPTARRIRRLHDKLSHILANMDEAADQKSVAFVNSLIRIEKVCNLEVNDIHSALYEAHHLTRDLLG